MSGTAVAVERARAFVADHGDALDHAVAKALVGAIRVAEALAPLPDPAAVDPATLVRGLAACADLRALDHAFARGATRRLAALQSEAGDFGGEDEAARRVRAGLLGGYLARGPFVRPAALEAIGDFLARQWSPVLVQTGDGSDLAAYAHYFANAPHDDADAILQWCGRELEKGFREQRFGAAQVAGVLGLCDAHAIPGATFEPGELVVALVTEQAPDGGFPAAGVPFDGRAAATRAGLVSLVRLDSQGATR